MSDTTTAGAILLTRSDVAGLLDLDECIAAVERAFEAHGTGRAPAPSILGVHVPDGAFHIKAAAFDPEHPVFVSKTNANFVDNRARFGLPTIQGTIVLHDATNGVLLGLLDSIEISIRRTGAATAVAAKYLAREDATVAAVCGAGEQGRVQLRSVARVLPLETAYVWDVDGPRARQMARDLEDELGFAIEVAHDFRAAAAGADVCITCTTSSDYLLGAADIGPGTFVAGVGVDNPHKKELAPDLLARSTVVVDVLDQCATIGDLHHAVEAGVMTREQVHGELGRVVAGTIPGRTSPDEITVFDSTGMALQDAATTVAVYERALEAGAGLRLDFGK